MRYFICRKKKKSRQIKKKDIKKRRFIFLFLKLIKVIFLISFLYMVLYYFINLLSFLSIKRFYLFSIIFKAIFIINQKIIFIIGDTSVF